MSLSFRKKYWLSVATAAVFFALGFMVLNGWVAWLLWATLGMIVVGLCYADYRHSIHVVFVDDYNLEDLVYIEQKCFPAPMRESMQSYYDHFQATDSFGLLVYDTAWPVGAIVGEPANPDNSEGMFELINEMGVDTAKVYYAYSIAVLEGYRNPKNLFTLYTTFAAELEKRGFTYTCCHVRKKRGYANSLIKVGGVTKLGTYDNWQGFGEPFEMILIDNEEFVSKLAWSRRNFPFTYYTRYLMWLGRNTN